MQEHADAMRLKETFAALDPAIENDGKTPVDYRDELFALMQILRIYGWQKGKESVTDFLRGMQNVIVIQDAVRKNALRAVVHSIEAGKEDAAGEIGWLHTARCILANNTPDGRILGEPFPL
jgi:hypothetical protein